MGYLEYNIILEIQCKYYRYVEDCCIISNNIEDSCALFYKLHKIDRITFTKQNELNNKVAFLDVLITRNDGRFLTSVYKKSSFIVQNLNFQSSCSKRRKIDLIKTLYH